MEKNGVSWDYYDKEEFDKIDELYLPNSGEGDNMANQIVVSINKLVYRYYNDGDVIDNSWTYDNCGNDVTSYANWLFYCVPQAKKVLNKYRGNIHNESEYEQMLKELSDTCLNMELLKEYESKEKLDTIYDFEGVFKLENFEDEDDWY